MRKYLILSFIFLISISCAKTTHKDTTVRKSYPITNLIYFWNIDKKNVIIKYQGNVIYDNHVTATPDYYHSTSSFCFYSKNNFIIMSNYTKEWIITDKESIKLEIKIENDSLTEIFFLNKKSTLFISYYEEEKKGKIITNVSDEVMFFY